MRKEIECSQCSLRYITEIKYVCSNVGVYVIRVSICVRTKGTNMYVFCSCEYYDKWTVCVSILLYECLDKITGYMRVLGVSIILRQVDYMGVLGI
jgi:hypothetical protein